jgi:hypothetical protein
MGIAGRGGAAAAIPAGRSAGEAATASRKSASVPAASASSASLFGRGRAGEFAAVSRVSDGGGTEARA